MACRQFFLPFLFFSFLLYRHEMIFLLLLPLDIIYMHDVRERSMMVCATAEEERWEWMAMAVGL